MISLKTSLKPFQSALDRLRSMFSGNSLRRQKRHVSADGTSQLACERLESRYLLTLYDVGPGLAYTSIGAVPWSTLQAGDTVEIHGRATPYHEMILVSGQGTADAPIKIMGVPGPNGEKPIIDGQNAVLGPNLDYLYPTGTPTRGLLTISPSSQDAWGYKPAFIEISGLEFRDANPGNSFTRPDGTTSAFQANAAGIFVERGENITISDCEIDHNGNGLFVASGDSEEVTSRNILVQGNSIHDNGNVGSDHQHNVYTEAIGITFEDNHFGPLLPGSDGSNLKDRSAGLVVRDNWFEGGAHLLDLVDAEDCPLAVQDPSYQQTFVYGNILVDTAGPGNSSNLVHYGGDSGDAASYRQGTLYFYQNTVMIQGTRSGTDARWFTDVFRFDTNQQIADIRNNIFYCGLPPDAPAGTDVTGLGLFDDTAGTATFGVNWVSPDWHAWRNDDVPAGSSITGTSNFLTNSANDPGFTDLGAFDFHLLSSSESIDQAGAQASAVIGKQDPVDQYVVHQSHIARIVVGSALDLGAFEGPAPVGPGNIQFPATTITVSEKVGIAHLTVNRVGGSSGAVTVHYSIVGVSAVDGVDFHAASGTLNFADGQTSATIGVSIIDNLLSGPNKTLQVLLSNATDGAGLGAGKSLVVTIQNDESQVAGPSVVQFNQATYSVLVSAGQVVINVTRTGDLSSATTVQFQTKQGTAKAGKNFVSKSGQIQFASGQATQQITIQLVQATIGKRPKAFTVSLLSATQGAKVNSKAKLAHVKIAD
ncbi:MAG: hypothetical protein JWM11_7017 [Planctomycetaceae bacterium]|nr:hypothetical protein [Planctomycetaceae bacterium]